MNSGPVLLDSDVLSLLSRGDARVTARALVYLERHGRLTLSAVTVFERLRGYQAVLREGKPFGEQFAKFRALVAASVVLPVDESVAEQAAVVWSQVGPRARKAIGDILIAATASVHRLPLVTRNRRDFEPMARCAGVDLLLIDWSQ